jgi:succinate dehydrogenase / fumarate reductase cytochrome b subunit
MATSALPIPTQPPVRGIKKVQPLRPDTGHSFLWRKLHSLSGLIPIGAFLIEHILSNIEALGGPAAYGHQVRLLNSLPQVRVLEWAFIFIPLAFHALYGLWIALRGRATVNVYPWAGNWGYLTQRITGIIAFAYIIQHVWRQRFSGVMLPEHPGAAFAKVQHELANPWMLTLYIVAMIATCWHFSYGIWLFAAKWGITPGDRAIFGTALCILGLASIYAFVGNPKFANAPADAFAPPAITAPAPSSTNPPQPGEVR